MDITEKNQLIEVVKSSMTEIAKKESEGQLHLVKGEMKSLEEKIEKALDGLVPKAEFDKMENEFQKQLSAFKDKEAQNITFDAMLIKSFTDAKELMHSVSKGGSKRADFEIRKNPATLTSATSLGATNAVNAFAVFNNREIVPIARRQRHIREVFGMGATDESVYPYLRETPKEGVVSVQNPEGAPKAQIEYKSELVTATASTIAAFQKIGRQTLADVRGLASFVQVAMINDLMIKEDNDLLFANGTNGAVLGVFGAASLNATNIPASFKLKSPNIYDSIAAFAATLAGREYTASAAMINPIDYWRMVAAKADDAKYLQNIIFDTATSTLFVFGIPVIATTAVPAGFIGVADARYVMPLQREGLSLSFFEQDEDNIQRNVITARVEERILNVVRRTDAFAYDSLANIQAAIDILAPAPAP